MDEALCFGWVDSLIKKIDEKRYARKFTPRRDDSKWSLVNKTRVEQLMQDDLMTEFGLRKVEAAKCSGSWDAPVQKPKMDFKMRAEFSNALKNNPQAEEVYNKLTASHQKEYLAWIGYSQKDGNKGEAHRGIDPIAGKWEKIRTQVGPM